MKSGIKKREEAPVAGLSMPATISGYLQQALGTLDIELASASSEQAWAASQRGLQMEIAGKILAGRALIHLRDTLDKQGFSAGLAERGIARRTAYDAIDIYGLFASLPDASSVRALAQLGVTKTMALQGWAHDDLASLAHGETVNGLTLEQATDMSSRELEALTRKALESDARVSTLESEKTRLEAELNKLRESVKKTRALQAVEDLPAFAREAREEAMVLSEQMMLAVELLEDVAARNLLAQVDHPERLRWQPAAARTMVHALGAPIARAAALINRLCAHFGDEITGALDTDSLLEVGEARLFLESRDRLTARAREEAQEREDERANTQAGRRGRKRGSGRSV